MRARPNLSGDQLVQDYLTRVAAAARHLPKGARMAFVGRTKAQIERQVAAAGTDDPGKLVEVLAELGDPEELVRAERLRIDNKWLKKRGQETHPEPVTGAPPAGSGPPRASRPRVYQPRVHRGLRSRWKPATPPPPQKPAAESAEPDDTITGRVIGKGLAPTSPPPTSPAPTSPAPTSPARTSPARTSPAPSSPPPESPAPWPDQLDAMMPPGPVPGEDDGTAPGTQTPLDGVWQLARGHLLESVAVVLIGLGGALLPFPFWLAGALVALFSRLWDGRDKVAAIGGPILMVFLGSIVSALLMGGHNNVVAIYIHAMHVDTGLWIRIGCVLTAVYLGWRVSKGRRIKVPPWKR
jgi:hypothetical protein